MPEGMAQGAEQGVPSPYISFMSWSKPLSNIITAAQLTHTPIRTGLLPEILLVRQNSLHFHFAIVWVLASTKLSHKFFLCTQRAETKDFQQNPPETATDPLPWTFSSLNQAELLPKRDMVGKNQPDKAAPTPAGS